jgi:NodT family efflux transporter outer membrane factor (OMF) lipoprotein
MRTLPLIALFLTSACSMNPKLETPAPPIAQSFPDATPQEAASTAALDWRNMFADARLQAIIEVALENNRDLRVTALNVEAARAQFRVARGALLPQVDANGGYTRQRIPTAAAAAGIGGIPGGGEGPSGIEFEQYSANAALTSFEIDLFGRLRSQSQAAFERYLASDEGRRAARIALIGSVVDAYLEERLAQEQLALTDRTLEDWTTALEITRKRHEAKQVSGVDIAQAEGQVRQAEADQAMRTRALSQARNALQLLVGAPLPADLPAPISLMDQPIQTQLPAGLPSDLIANRPDIRQAEHTLIAANADVGAARAAFFPRLSLTGLFGFTSLAFDICSPRTTAHGPSPRRSASRSSGMGACAASCALRRCASPSPSPNMSERSRLPSARSLTASPAAPPSHSSWMRNARRPKRQQGGSSSRHCAIALASTAAWNSSTHSAAIMPRDRRCSTCAGRNSPAQQACIARSGAGVETQSLPDRRNTNAPRSRAG